MARPKETHQGEFTTISFRDDVVKIWGYVASKDRDVIFELNQESAEKLIANIKKAFEGIEQRKAELAERKYQEYLALRAQFESRAVAELPSESEIANTTFTKAE